MCFSPSGVEQDPSLSPCRSRGRQGRAPNPAPPAPFPLPLPPRRRRLASPAKPGRWRRRGPLLPIAAAVARAGVVAWGGGLDRGCAGAAGGGVAARWCLMRARWRRRPVASSSSPCGGGFSLMVDQQGPRRPWRRRLHVDGGEDSTGAEVGLAPEMAMARVSRSRSGPVGPDLVSSTRMLFVG